jgi:hypothetical protein
MERVSKADAEYFEQLFTTFNERLWLYAVDSQLIDFEAPLGNTKIGLTHNLNHTSWVVSIGFARFLSDHGVQSCAHNDPNATIWIARVSSTIWIPMQECMCRCNEMMDVPLPLHWAYVQKTSFLSVGKYVVIEFVKRPTLDTTITINVKDGGPTLCWYAYELVEPAYSNRLAIVPCNDSTAAPADIYDVAASVLGGPTGVTYISITINPEQPVFVYRPF